MKNGLHTVMNYKEISLIFFCFQYTTPKTKRDRLCDLFHQKPDSNSESDSHYSSMVTNWVNTVSLTK